MAKLTIEISEQAYPILKEWAKKDERSLTSYLHVLFDNLTGVQPRSIYLPINVTHTTITETVTHPVIQFTPENPTGQTYTPTSEANDSIK